MKFLEVAKDQALQNKLLLSGYEQPGDFHNRAKKCPSASINTTYVSDSGDHTDKKERDCGKCPLCKGFHTFYNSKKQMKWPSDRLFKCDDFKNQSVKDRASCLEKFGCCPKCTCWNHKKSDCRTGNKFTALISGRKCGGIHSTMVCGSGSAYCGAVKPTLVSSSSSSTSSS